MTKFIFSNSKLTYTLELDPSLAAPYPSLGKFMRGNSADLLDKINGLYTLTPPCKTYCEPMAGVGIAAGLVRMMHDPQMVLNDLDPGCASVLRERFPGAGVSCDDSFLPQWWEGAREVSNRFDVVFMDNSSTTLRRVDDCWEQAVSSVRKTFLYTDTFPFSIIPFDRDRLMQYLKEVDGWMEERKLWVTDVYLYSSRRVMIVRADRKPAGGIRLVDAALPFQFEKREGLFE